MPNLNKRPSDDSTLVVIPRIPWPPACGASVANCSLIQSLVRRGTTVDLLCLSRSARLPELQKIREQLHVRTVELIRLPLLMRFFPLRIILCLLNRFRYSDIPITAIPFVAGGTGRRLFELVQSGRWANIIWDGLHPMSVLISEGISNQKISFAPTNHFYRAHNCESEIWRQYQCNAAPFLRPLLISETKRMFKLERRSIDFASATLCINECDAKLLKTLAADAQKIITLPVELPLSSPRRQKSRMTETQQQQQLQQTQSKHDSPLRLLWMGGLDWWPNKQGLAWFFETVWPKLAAVRKDVHICLTGRGTQKIKMKSGAGSERVSANGFVEDPLPLLRDAHILIVPVFFGSGIRIKALEALINGVPCIGTTAGLSGIAEDGCWISDSAEEWCTVLSTLSVKECADKGATGKAAVQQRHSPHMTDQIMDLLFSSPDAHRAG